MCVCVGGGGGGGGSGEGKRYTQAPQANVTNPVLWRSRGREGERERGREGERERGREGERERRRGGRDMSTCTNLVAALSPFTATVTVAGLPRMQYELHILRVKNGTVDGLL